MNNERLQERLLEIGLDRFDGDFANGQRSNNKLNLGYQELHRHKGVLAEVAIGLARLIKDYDPQFVIGVPSGASGLARYEVAQELDVWPTCLIRDDKTGQFKFATEVDRYVVNNLKRGALIEDVFRTGFSTKKALALPGMAERIQVVAAVFDRGDPERREPLSVPLHSLVSRHIPLDLPSDSELWQYVAQPKIES